jgi:chromosome segregation ATPase
LQLDDATASLDLKTSTISELETRVDELKGTLDNITTDLETTRQNLENAECAKATAEKELVETRTALVASQGESDMLGQISNEVRPHF